MVHAVASAGRLALSGRMTLMLAAPVLACGMAAWVAGLDPVALALNAMNAAMAPAPLQETSFEDRFTSTSALNVLPPDLSPRRLVQALVPEAAEREARLQDARAELTQKLTSDGWRVAVLGEPAPIPAPAPPGPAVVPLPMARPAQANMETAVSAAPVQAEKENRSLLQKLADALPVPFTLASLAPDGGVSSDGPDLGALGYDNVTAVYDISARAVFLPNGTRLEAHSGFGGLKDDPAHVDRPDVGATPPNVYELKPRERLFHGVRALRMVAVGGDTLGRTGLLTHSYMLGPNGDSNGCVSIKSYDRFLAAYQNGEIKRLVVVASLGDATAAARRSNSQS
jgi:hypothetical protein